MSQSPTSPGQRLFATTVFIVGVATFLYVAALLAIAPYASGASHHLFQWPQEAASASLVPPVDVLFPPLARLGLVEKPAGPTGIEYANKVASLIDTALKIVALVVGGLFAYWKFFMGRTFHPRLEPTVTASARTEDGQVFLKVSCKVKNVGLSSVDLDKDLSIIEVFLQDLAVTTYPAEVAWRKESDLWANVFTSHGWIEGGETIEDAHLFVFPYVQNRTCRVELQVFRAQRSLSERLREWRRRRKGPNAWAHHAVLDELTPTKSPNDPETRPNDHEPQTR